MRYGIWEKDTRALQEIRWGSFVVLVSRMKWCLLSSVRVHQPCDFSQRVEAPKERATNTTEGCFRTIKGDARPFLLFFQLSADRAEIPKSLRDSLPAEFETEMNEGEGSSKVVP